MRTLAPIGVGCLVLLSAGALVAGIAPGLRAADHLDAPGLTSPDGNLMADLADLFVFTPDGKKNQVALIATYNPAAGVFGPAGFDPTVTYALNIDTDDDAVADMVYGVTFDAPGGNTRQDYTVWLDGVAVASGRTGRKTRFDSGNGRAFAGVADDPFFFDLDAFLGSGGRGFCDGSSQDFRAHPPAPARRSC